MSYQVSAKSAGLAQELLAILNGTDGGGGGGGVQTTAFSSAASTAPGAGRRKGLLPKANKPLLSSACRLPPHMQKSTGSIAASATGSVPGYLTGSMAGSTTVAGSSSEVAVSVPETIPAAAQGRTEDNTECDERVLIDPIPRPSPAAQIPTPPSPSSALVDPIGPPPSSTACVEDVLCPRLDGCEGTVSAHAPAPVHSPATAASTVAAHISEISGEVEAVISPAIAAEERGEAVAIDNVPDVEAEEMGEAAFDSVAAHFPQETEAAAAPSPVPPPSPPTQSVENASLIDGTDMPLPSMDEVAVASGSRSRETPGSVGSGSTADPPAETAGGDAEVVIRLVSGPLTDEKYPSPPEFAEGGTGKGPSSGEASDVLSHPPINDKAECADSEFRTAGGVPVLPYDDVACAVSSPRISGDQIESGFKTAGGRHIVISEAAIAAARMDLLGLPDLDQETDPDPDPDQGLPSHLDADDQAAASKEQDKASISPLACPPLANDVLHPTLFPAAVSPMDVLHPPVDTILLCPPPSEPALTVLEPTLMVSTGFVTGGAGKAVQIPASKLLAASRRLNEVTAVRGNDVSGFITVDNTIVLTAVTLSDVTPLRLEVVTPEVSAAAISSDVDTAPPLVPACGDISVSIIPDQPRKRGPDLDTNLDGQRKRGLVEEQGYGVMKRQVDSPCR